MSAILRRQERTGRADGCAVVCSSQIKNLTTQDLRMTDETRRLTRCLTFIKENTSQVEKILDKLIEDGIICLDERALILTNPLIESQIHSIIETVIRKQAHGAFLRALQTTGNNHVVDRIMQIQVSTGMGAKLYFTIGDESVN